MTRLSNFDPSETLPAEDDVADAIRTFPLEAAAPGFAAGVMARLRALPPTVRPRFRLTWYDLVISLTTTGLAGTGYLVWQMLPPQVIAQIQMTWILWVQRIALFLPHLPS